MNDKDKNKILIPAVDCVLSFPENCNYLPDF